MIKVLQIIFTLTAIACIVGGISVVSGYLDAAALFDLPATFNNPCAFTLIVTGVWVLLVPYLPNKQK